MKKIIAIIVILIIILIGATFFVGDVAEKRFRQVVATLNEVPGVSAKVDSYKKSLFYAVAHTTIIANGVTYGFDSVIHHGPIVFQDLSQKKKGFSSPIKFKIATVTNKLVSMTVAPSTVSSATTPRIKTDTANINQSDLQEKETTNEMTAQTTEQSKEQAAEQGAGQQATEQGKEQTIGQKSILPKVPIVWEMSFPYSGDVEVTSQGPAYDVTLNQFYLKSSGWDSTGHFSNDGKYFDITTGVEEVGLGSAPDKNIFVNLKGIVLSNNYKDAKEVKTTQTSLTIDKIEVPMVKGLEADFLKIKVNVAKKATTMDIVFGISLDMLNLGGNQPTIGPERIQIGASNLDLGVMNVLMSKKSTELTSEQNKELMLKIVQGKPKITLENIEINLPENLQLQMPKGKISIDGFIILGGKEITDLNNAEQILKSIDAEINGSITKEILRSIIESNRKSEMLNQMMIQKKAQNQNLSKGQMQGQSQNQQLNQAPNQLQNQTRTQLQNQNQTQNQAQNPLMNMAPEQMDAAIKQSVDQIIAELIAENVLTEKDTMYDFNLKISNGHWVNKDTGAPVKILESTIPLSKQTMSSTTPTPAQGATKSPAIPPAVPSATSQVPIAPATPSNAPAAPANMPAAPINSPANTPTSPTSPAPTTPGSTAPATEPSAL